MPPSAFRKLPVGPERLLLLLMLDQLNVPVTMALSLPASVPSATRRLGRVSVSGTAALKETLPREIDRAPTLGALPSAASPVNTTLEWYARVVLARYCPAMLKLPAE